MRLRSHLLLLTLFTLLPMVIFGITAVAFAVQREKSVFERGARERTLALLTAVDTELEGHKTSVQALAASRNLEGDDLPAFYDEANRTLGKQPRWRDINLALPNGKRLFDAALPLEAERPPIGERESFDEAVRSGKPVIGGLFRDGGEYVFAVRLPIVVDDGTTKYVLSALVDPKAIVELLGRQELPADWVGVVLDRHRRIVARTMNQAETLGQRCSLSLSRALDDGSEGWFHGSTLEGADVYTPFNRSQSTGWTVATGIPAAVVEAGARDAAWILSFGVLLALAAAVTFAAALSHRISAPIAFLASMARDLARGGPVRSPERFRVQEVHDVSRALVHAANAVRERESALRAADRAKDEFLAMLGHELRNPLSALASGVEVLRLGGEKDTPSGVAAAVIGRQVQHMTRMVDDLLDVSRVTKGKVKLSRKPIDLGEVVANAVNDLRAAGRLGEHELVLEVDSVWIDADEARIEQITSNLVGNAIKYTPAGGKIMVCVTCEGESAVLQVTDTGVGLSPELAPRVFDLFVQGEQPLDRGLGGLGIGLTLVRCLAELHGGTVSATSEGDGRGARFTVTLPKIGAPPLRPTSENALPCTDLLHRRVLLVEDNEDVRGTLHAALSLHGHEVLVAADGPGGIEAARKSHPDVAVVDIGLPGFDGYELAQRLRAMDDGKSIFLVALTGYGQRETRERATEAGFDEYLTKPVSPDRLAQLIVSGSNRKALDRRANSSSG